MRLIQNSHFSHDDVDCARTGARGKAARAFYELVLQTFNSRDPDDLAAVRSHPCWSKHCKRLTKMRLSGELDRINRERAFTGTFFREYNLQQYAEWRERQRSILQSTDQQVPDWLRKDAAPIPGVAADR